MKKASLLMGFLGTGLLATSTLFAAPVELKLKWEPGKEYIYKQKMDMNMTMPMPGRQGAMKTASVMEQKYKQTTSEHHRGVLVRLSFDSFKMSNSMNGQKMIDLDSENPATVKGPMKPMVDGVLGTSIEAVYDKTGAIVKVQNFQGGGGMANQIVNQEMIEEMLRAGGRFLPEKAVNPGDAWDAVYDFNMPQVGKMNVNMKMKLDSVSAGVAKISFTGDMNLAPAAGQAVGLNMKAEKFLGTIDFDISKGVIKESVTEMKLLMTPPAEALGANAPNKLPIDSKTVQTLIEIRDL